MPSLRRKLFDDRVNAEQVWLLTRAKRCPRGSACQAQWSLASSVWIPSRRNATKLVGASPCQGRSALTAHEAPLELFRVIKADANERAEQAEGVTDGCLVYPSDGALDLGTKLGALGSEVCWLSWTFPNPPLSAITCTRLEWYSFCWPLDVGHACCNLRT